MTYPNDNDRRNLVYDDDYGSGSLGVIAAGAALLFALVVGIFLWNGNAGEQQTASNDRSNSSSTINAPVTQPLPNAVPQNPATATPPNG
jgi:hypothetical protein